MTRIADETFDTKLGRDLFVKVLVCKGYEVVVEGMKVKWWAKGCTVEVGK